MGSAGMTIHKPLYLDFMESPVVLGPFILSWSGPWITGFSITTGSAGMTIHKPLYLDFMKSPVALGLFYLVVARA
jgi:hypothetical protein